jgi:hypothetical protein
MVVFAALAGLVSVVVSWVVGIRLIRLSRRTRQAPELMIGVALLLAGGVWSPLVMIGRQASSLPDPVRAALMVVGALAGVAGMSGLALFDWRVYRPGTRWAPALVAVYVAALAAVFVVQTVGDGWTAYAHTENGMWIGASWIGIAIYAWTVYEAWRQDSMQRRRAALGLADPVVTDRMRVWAIGITAGAAGATLMAICQSLGIPVAGTLAGLAFSGVVALVVSVCLWLAFAPPPSYLARVRRLAAAAEA